MRLIWPGSGPGQDAVRVLVLIAGIRGSTGSDGLVGRRLFSVTAICRNGWGRTTMGHAGDRLKAVGDTGWGLTAIGRDSN